ILNFRGGRTAYIKVCSTIYITSKVLSPKMTEVQNLHCVRFAIF
ncbi:Os10g0420800, partial [Oryza sativa Japonica Group]